MNHCHKGGYLVGPEQHLPDDLTDYGMPALPTVGCNRLRCNACGAWVRSAHGVAIAEGVTREQAYEERDPTSSPRWRRYVPQYRTYFCRCNGFYEQIEHAMDDPVDDIRTDPEVDWRCAGHPIVELPHDIDGVRIEPGAVAEVTRRALGGWIPDGAPSKVKSGALWLTRLSGRLAGTPQQPDLVREVFDAMTDEEPRRRAMALNFFVKVNSPDAIRKAVELLRGSREGYAGVRDEVTELSVDKDLVDTLWRLVTPAVEGAESVRRLVREEALRPGQGTMALYAALARFDGDWVAEHAGEIVRATPTHAEELGRVCDVWLKPDRLAAAEAKIAAELRRAKA